MTAEQFILLRDSELGEVWSQDTEDLAKAFDEYLSQHLDKFAEEVKEKQFEVDNFNNAVLIEDIDKALKDYKLKNKIS